MNKLFGFVVLAVVAMVVTLLFVLPTPDSVSANLATANNETRSSSVFIENVYVTDRDGRRTTASILMEEGTIRQIEEGVRAPRHATVIDGSGLTAIPGLIDSHTHSYGSALADALQFGVTTSIDMASMSSLLADAHKQRKSVLPVDGADLFSAGMLATVEGGHGTQFGMSVSTLSAPSEALEWVRARKLEGSDFIKLVYIPYQSRIPSLDRATAKAVIEAAHAEGLMALAHVSTQRAALEMVQEGIDGLVHVFADEAVSDEFVTLARDSNLFVIPTLAVIASVAGEDDPDSLLDDVQPWLSPMQKQTLESRFSDVGSGFRYQIALDNVNRLHAAGVRIVAGSDAPNPGTAHGYSLHYELKLLVDAGLSPVEAVRAATELPSSIFGLADRGALREGLRADLLLVQGNPYQDVRSSRQIKHVIKNGYEVSREETVLETAPALTSSVLSSFDDHLDGPDGWAWAATDDTVMGGSSTAVATRAQREGGGYALAIQAEVKPGFAYPWAGVGFASRNPEAAASLAAYQNVVFEIKGTPGKYRFMLFSGMGAGAPPTLEFDVTSEWRTVSLSLDKFAGFNPEAFSMLSIVGGTAAKAIEFTVDEVRFE